MSLVKVCGLETEYGLWIADPGRLRQQEAAVALLERCPLPVRIPWDTSGESPGSDARTNRPAGRHAAPPQAPARRDAGCHAGFMLGNGARLYADHGHPEYSTPECADAATLVACDKAGERLLERCRRHLNDLLPAGQSIRLFKNNSDRQGHSYGCHENYLLAAATYESLFRERIGTLHATLVPFLVSRVVVSGAGKVGSENGRPPAGFQLSQRADFFARVVGLETMSERPIVNTRDESHADGARFRRLHVISGDANMAQVSTQLKVGTLQLLLAMLEDGARLPDLTLDDPLSAMVRISHDPTCRARVALRDGRRLSAVEIQLELAAAAQSHLDASPAAAAAYRPLLARWTSVLERLAADPVQLAGTLDWAIKWKFLEEWRQRKGLAWSAAELAELDLRYHDIDPARSVFYLLAAQGGIEEVVDPAAIARAEGEPPEATRAGVRGAILRRERAQVLAASWSSIVQDGGGREPVRHVFDDPAAGNGGVPGAGR
jgi:proteasome accessory factor PafA2